MHVLPMFAQGSSGFFGFLPPTKNMQISGLVTLNLP